MSVRNPLGGVLLREVLGVRQSEGAYRDVGITLPTLREQLEAFNEERKRLMGKKPAAPGERMPLPYTGVGGDVPNDPTR